MIVVQCGPGPSHRGLPHAPASQRSEMAQRIAELIEPWAVRVRQNRREAETKRPRATKRFPSVDTKKKELVGQQEPIGRVWVKRASAAARTRVLRNGDDTPTSAIEVVARWRSTASVHGNTARRSRALRAEQVRRGSEQRAWPGRRRSIARHPGIRTGQDHFKGPSRSRSSILRSKWTLRFESQEWEIISRGLSTPRWSARVVSNGSKWSGPMGPMGPIGPIACPRRVGVSAIRTRAS